MTVRIPPELARIISVLFDSKKWPYLTSSDLVRHALFNHVEWLDMQDPEEHGLQYLRAMNDQLTEEECNVQFGRMMNKLHSVIKEHVDHGDMDDATRVVNHILGAIKGMPAGTMKQRYEKEIMGAYGDLAGEVIEVIRLVDLDPSKAVEDDA